MSAKILQFPILRRRMQILRELSLDICNSSDAYTVECFVTHKKCKNLIDWEMDYVLYCSGF